jgi:hypothetical protein
MSNAMNIFPLMAIMSAFLSFLFSIFLDKISIRYILVAIFLVDILMTGALELVRLPYELYLFILCAGMNWAFYGILIAVPWLKLFGKNILGKLCLPFRQLY